VVQFEGKDDICRINTMFTVSSFRFGMKISAKLADSFCVRKLPKSTAEVDLFLD